MGSLKKYIAFLLSSTNQHGVHSPFIYSLITKCLYAKTNRETSRFIAGIRKHYSGKHSLKQAQLVHRLMTYFKVKNVMVLTERSSLNIAVIDHFTLKQHALFSFRHTLEQSSFKHFNPKQLQNTGALKTAHFMADLVFIDKSMDRFTIASVFENIIPYLNENTVLIIDGIHKNHTVEKQWEALKKHPVARQSLDLFFWGILFFRKKQVKEHFKVRV